MRGCNTGGVDSVGVHHTRINCQCSDKSCFLSQPFFIRDFRALAYKTLQAPLHCCQTRFLWVYENTSVVTSHLPVIYVFIYQPDICHWISLGSNKRQLTKISESINTLYHLYIWKKRIWKNMHNFKFRHIWNVHFSPIFYFSCFNFSNFPVL